MLNKSREYIFVYGTLRRDCGGIMAHCLSRHAEFLGMGFFQGALYEVNRYPGAVLCSEKHDRVWGELYRMHDSKNVLTKLDDYEECSGRFPEPHEYKRLKAEITLPAGEPVLAWVYVYNFPVGRLERIHSGDYPRYLLEKSTA